MSKYNKTVLTNTGLDLAIKAARGKTKFTITKTAASADNLADKKIEELQELTELPNIVQYGQIVDVADSTQDKNVVIGVGLYFNNQDLTQSYDLNTIALFAKEEGSDKEILYALTTAVEPETMPDYQDDVLFKFNLTMYVVVGRTDNVTVKVVEDGVVTDKKLEERLQAFATKNDLAKLEDSVKDQIKNAGQVKTVDGIAPDKDGNVQTDHYTKAEIDQKVTDINDHIATVENREITHVCDDYDTGVEYSKNHKDVFVAVTGN